MAVPVGGKILIDTNVFVDYLRAGMHSGWVIGPASGRIRFLSSVVLLELRLGADTRARRKAVDRIRLAFPAARQISPSPRSFDRAGRLFPLLYGRMRGDRLGPMNDLLIGLTAREIGAAVVTRNLVEFQRIATAVSGLAVLAP
ncbi:MAG: type II toxin-antitoxin system VapC family toxin [Candidatus Binatia bacterium]